jgi:hypothetical protein
MSLVGILTLVLMIGLAALSGWAFLTSTRKGTLPTTFFTALNALHVFWLAAVIVGLVTDGGSGGIRRVIEYLIVFVGAGIVYTRGLLPKGFMWRILTDPPNVPWGMFIGNAWSAAAALGFVFFSLNRGQ